MEKKVMSRDVECFARRQNRDTQNPNRTAFPPTLIFILISRTTHCHMSADVHSKGLLEQAGVLTKWLLETDEWRPYRGNVEIGQCSHPDRMEHIKPMIKAMNVEVRLV